MLGSGKTKEIWEIPGKSDQVILLSNDMITAGNGKKKHKIVGKGKIANETTIHVFTILRRAGKYCTVMSQVILLSSASSGAQELCAKIILNQIFEKFSRNNFRIP